jgi:hypothetical protein
LAYNGQLGETIWNEAFDDFEMVTVRAVALAREQFVRERARYRKSTAARASHRLNELRSTILDLRSSIPDTSLSSRRTWRALRGANRIPECSLHREVLGDYTHPPGSRSGFRVK